MTSVQKECFDQIRQQGIEIIECQEQQEILHEPNNWFDLKSDGRQQGNLRKQVILFVNATAMRVTNPAESNAERTKVK